MMARFLNTVASSYKLITYMEGNYLAGGDILLEPIQKYTQSNLHRVSSFREEWGTHIGVKDLSNSLVRSRNVTSSCRSHSIQ